MIYFNSTQTICNDGFGGLLRLVSRAISFVVQLYIFLSVMCESGNKNSMSYEVND